MYLYKGYNPETKEKQQKEFSDEYEATYYATDIAYRFHKFNIIDLGTDEIIFDDKELENTEATAMNNMFPDEDSVAGFDWTLGE